MGYVTFSKIEKLKRDRQEERRQQILAQERAREVQSRFSQIGEKHAEITDTIQKFAQPVRTLIPDTKLSRAYKGGEIDTAAVSGSALSWLGAEVDSAALKGFAQGWRGQQLEELKEKGLETTGQEGRLEQAVRSTPNTLAVLSASILAGMLTGPKGARAVGGLSTMALEGGSAYQEALDAGATEEQAKMTARVTGSINGAIETIVPWNTLNQTIGKVIGKGVVKEAKKEASKSIVKSIAKFGWGSVKQAIGEGGQEMLQEITGNLAAKYNYAPDKSWDENVREAGEVGALMGLMFSLIPGFGGNQMHVQQPGAAAPTEETKIKEPIKEPIKQTPAEEFRSTLKVIPQDAKVALTEAVTRPMTIEGVEQLTTQERAVIGVGLNVAKQLPNVDLVTINKNIKLIEQSGVEIPTKTLEQQVLEEEQTKKLPTGEKKQLDTQKKPVAVGKPFSVVKAPEASIKPPKIKPKKAEVAEKVTPLKLKKTLKKGDTVVWNGKGAKVGYVLDKERGETKYGIEIINESGDKTTIGTNRATLESEIKAKNLGITTNELMKRKNAELKKKKLPKKAKKVKKVKTPLSKAGKKITYIEPKKAEKKTTTLIGKFLGENHEYQELLKGALEGKKVTKASFAKAGVPFSKSNVRKLMSVSKEFKQNPVFKVQKVGKEKRLMWKGKQTTLKLKPEAFGIPGKQVKVGETIRIDEKSLKEKGTSQIPILAKLQKMTEKEQSEVKEGPVFFSGVGKDRKITNVDYTTTFRKAEKEFRQFISKSELPLKMADSIISQKGTQAFGVTTREFVAFIRNPKENTAPHEAVHAYIQLFLGQKKFDKLIAYVKKNKLAKGASTVKAEEWLADNFEYYIAEKKMKESDSKIKKLFNWVRKQVLNLSGKEDKIEAFYNALYTKKRPGFLKKKLTKPVSDRTRFQELSEKEVTGIKDKIDEALTETLTTEKGNLRLQKVWDSALEKLYGKEAVGTIKIQEVLKNRMDEEIIVKGMQTSFTEGKRVARAKAVQRNIEMRQKQAKAIKDLRAKLKARFKKKEAISDAMKKEAVTYIKASIPPKLRGQFLTKVSKVKTSVNLKRTLDAVNAKRKNFERRDIAKSIDKTLKKIDKLPIDIQRTIIEITSKIDLKNRTEKLLKRLNATKSFLDSQAHDVEMPKKVMEELQILKKTPLKELSIDKLMEVNNKIKQLSVLGRNIIKNKEAVRKMTATQKLGDISKSSRNLDLKTKEERNRILLPDELNLRGKSLLKVKGFRRWLRNINLRQIGTDRVFLLLDKGQMDGPNMNLLMHPVDDAVSDATGKIATWRDSAGEILNPLTKEITSNMSAKEKGKRLATAYKKSQKVGKKLAIYAFSKETGGSRKLIESGRATEKDIAKITKEVESDVEMKARYTFMRTSLNEIFPELQKAYETLNPGQTINFVKNFFPMRTDYNLSQAQPGEGDFSAGLNFGSLKNRKREAKQTLRANAIIDFQNYMEQAIYYIEMAKPVRDAGDVINSERYGELVGTEAQSFLQTWLKITTRRGGHLRTPGTLSKVLDFLRVNLTISKLGVRPSSVIRQTTAYLNGVAAIGEKYQVLGTKMFMDAKTRSFVKSASPQMLNRAGGDILWQELSEKQAMKKIQEMSMSGIRIVDYMMAGPTWIGAYQQKLDELGLKLDMNKVNADARRHADLMTRMSHATAQFHKAPQFMFNENRSMWRAFYQFETFNLSNWSQWSQDVPRAWKNEGKGVASKKVAYLSMQIMMSGSVTYLNGKLIASLFYGGDDNDRSLKTSIIGELVQSVPFLNKIFGAWTYRNTPIVVLQSATDAMTSFVVSFRGKKKDTRLKHRLKAVTGITQMVTGLPPSFIIETLLKAIKK